MVVTTPATTSTARHLAIKLELIDGSPMDTGRTFEYRRNPLFVDITPRNHFIMLVLLYFFPILCMLPFPVSSRCLAIAIMHFLVRCRKKRLNSSVSVCRFK